MDLRVQACGTWSRKSREEFGERLGQVLRRRGLRRKLIFDYGTDCAGGYALGVFGGLRVSAEDLP